MRGIKFRGKFKSDGLWEFGSLWIDKDKYYINGTDNNWWKVIPETVGQYTGLKDKNGVEIYEGDKLSIVDETRNKGVVTVGFEEGGFIVFKGLAWRNIGHFNVGKNDFEVIGNIYESKDLLDKENGEE